MTTEFSPVQLEPAAQAFADATSKPPFAFQLGAEGGRAVLDGAQSGEIAKPDVKIEDRSIEGSPSHTVSIRIVRPKNAPATLPVIVYVHGGGWVFGNHHTHDRLIRELAVGAGAAVVFVNYTRSPEARFPMALEECYAVVRWIADEGTQNGFDPARLVIAGDSAGGNLAIGVTLLAKERGEPAISRQLLFYPVTNAEFDTGSYRQFADGYFLSRDAMQWFWDQYTTSPDERNMVVASPLRASTEQLHGLPPALVITAEADVLRDEGEAYANKLRAAGVDVTMARFQGIIHDFVMLNALADTHAARGAMLLATAWLREGFR